MDECIDAIMENRNRLCSVVKLCSALPRCRTQENIHSAVPISQKCGLMDSGVQKVASAVNYESCREQGAQREGAVSSGKVRKLLAAKCASSKCARGWVITVRFRCELLLDFSS